MALAEAARAHAPTGFVGTGARRRKIDSHFSWDAPSQPFVPSEDQQRFEADAAEWRAQQQPFVSPYNVEAFERILAKHPDALLRWVVLDTLCFGANIAYDGPRGPTRPSPPHRSARENASVIDQYLAEECAAGRIYMRRGLPPFANLRVSPLGCVPKTSEGVQTGWRTTHDLSFGGDESINSNIDQLLMQTSSLRQYLELVDSTPDPLLWKIDIKAAYRTLGVREVDQPLLGFVWREYWCAERAVGFGGRSSPARWGEVASIIEFALREAGLRLVRFVDDFLGCSPRAEAAAHWERALAIMRELGVPVANKPDKLVPPCERMLALGMWVDVRTHTVELPGYKLQRLREKAHTAAGQEWMRADELARLLGWLHDAHVACPHLRLMENALMSGLGSQRGSARVRLTAPMKHDLAALARALGSWSGVEISPSVRPTLLPAAYGMFVDASTSYGRGGYLLLHDAGAAEWFSAPWTALDRAWASCVGSDAREGQREATAWFELFAIVTALALWRHHFAGKHLVLFCDCEPAVAIVNGGRARSEACAHLARALGALLHDSHIILTVVHVPSWRNKVADLLSRAQVRAALRLLEPAYRSHQRRCPSLGELVPICSTPPTHSSGQA